MTHLNDSTWTEAYLRNNIVFALKTLFGEVGAAISFDIIDFSPSKNSFIIHCHEAADAIKIRAAITLQASFQGQTCCYRVLKTSSNLLGLAI